MNALGPGARPIRLLLVDCKPAVRRGLKMRFALEEDLVVVGEAGDATEAISLARALRPDVVLMEAEMPGASGIEATEKLRGAAPQSAVVIFTLRDDAATQERARAASGAAFVAKHHKEGIPLAAMKEWQRRTRSGEGTSTLRRAERRSTQLPCVTVEVREGAAVRRVRHGEVPSDGGGSPPPGPPFGRCLLVWPGCMFLARANTVDLILKSRR